MDLCQELVLEHSKRPHHAGLREPSNAQVHHIPRPAATRSPWGSSCAARGRSAILSDLSYDALGCSISTVSTSVLTDEVIGRSVQEALTSFTAMRTMLTSKGADPGDEQEIGRNGRRFSALETRRSARCDAR